MNSDDWSGMIDTYSDMTVILMWYMIVGRDPRTYRRTMLQFNCIVFTASSFSIDKLRMYKQ